MGGAKVATQSVSLDDFITRGLSMLSQKSVYWGSCLGTLLT